MIYAIGFKDIFLGVIALLFLIAFFYLIILILRYAFVIKSTPFDVTLKAFRNITISVVIDRNQDIVEKYCVYGNANHNQTISYEEFTYMFGATSLERFNDWLKKATDPNNFIKKRRIEIAVYDENHRKRIYRMSFQHYDEIRNRYFITMIDITDTFGVLQRIEKDYSASNDVEKFLDRVNERKKLSDDVNFDYIVTIKYKEYNSIAKDFKGDFIKMLNYSIGLKLNRNINESDLLCQNSNESYILFCGNIFNPKKLRKKLKSLMIKCSGQIATVKNRFNVTLVCGVSRIPKIQNLTTEIVYQSEIAANQALKKNERVRFYDEELSRIENERIAKLSKVRSIIENSDFTLEFIPVLDMESKIVIGFRAEFVSNASEINAKQFFDVAQDIGYRKALFQKIISQINEHRKNFSYRYFFTLEYHHLARLVEAFNSKETFSDLDFCVCLSLDEITLTDAQSSAIGKVLKAYNKNTNIKFGLIFENTSIEFFTQEIYNLMDVLVMKGQFTENMLSTYYSRINLEIVATIAKEYSLKMMAFDIKNLAQHETLYNLGCKNISGNLYTNKIINRALGDKQLLKNISEIERKEGE